jgi:uncharacterized membrane protein YjfL (UPF0719 family)
METINFSEYVQISYELAAYLSLAFVIFYIGKKVYSMFNRKIDINDELVEQDNLAFAIAHTGYFVGLVIVIGAVITGPSKGLLNDVIEISIYSLLSIFLMILSAKLNDKIIFPKFNFYDEIIRDRNIGAGAIEAANMIGCAIIISGAMQGETDDILTGVISVLIFWAVGQLILLLTSWVYNLITPYDFHEKIEEDNVAVGIGFSGAFIAISIIISYSISHPFYGILDSTVDILFHTIIGLLLLPMLRFLTDRVLLPGQNITDEIVNQEHPNIGAGVIEAFSYIGGALLLTWCL